MKPKNFIAIVTVTTVILSLSGCGKRETSQSPQNSDNTAASTEFIEESSSEKASEADSSNETEQSPDATVSSDENAEGTEGAVAPETTELPAEPTTSAAETTTAPETVAAPSDSEPAQTSDDGIRPEFKEALDSYEAFIDEYCDFMKKYNDDPTNFALLGEYADFMARYAEMTEKMNKLGEEDMNDAEAGYYLEVSARVSSKILEAAY